MAGGRRPVGHRHFRGNAGPPRRLDGGVSLAANGPAARRLRRPGPACALAARPLAAAPRTARAPGRDASRGRSGRAAQAGPAGRRDGRRPAAHRPRRYEVGGRGEDDRRALRRRGGRARRRRPPRVRAPPRASPHPHRARNRRDRRDPRDVVQPAVARGRSLYPARGCGFAASPNRYGFQVSSYDIGDAAQTADFAPVYPSTADLAQKTLRTLTEAALAFARDAGEPLPAAVRERDELPLRARTRLVRLHRPRSEAEAEQARRRLALDELLTLQLALRRRSAGAGGARRGRAAAGRAARRPLPRRAPVHAHGRAGRRDRRDRQRSRAHDADAAPAPGGRRLRQDRGGALRAPACGRGRAPGRTDGPTETLAEQHFLTIEGLCAELGVRVALLTSSLTARERRAAAPASSPPATSASVGTHALIQRESPSPTSRSPSSTSSTASASSSVRRSPRPGARTSST